MIQGHQPQIRNPIIRIVIIWAVESVALVLMSFILDGLAVEGAGTAVIATAVIGLFNALFWPFLSYVLLPFAVFTMGIMALVLNGFVIWLAGQFIPGFEVASLGTAIWTALGLTAINIIFSTMLTIDDDNSWYRNVVKRRARRMAKVEELDTPGIVFLEIDGLSLPILEEAMANGYAPVMKRWLKEGSHTVVEWETDFSSQTSASQAGILHGNNDNIPGFRWYDRIRKAVISSSDPDEIAGMEKRHSDGNGLLVNNGASRGNLLSGDAPFVSVTASMIKDFSRFHMTDYYAYFANPYNFARTLILAVWDIILEIRQFHRARRQNAQPRLDRKHRGGIYPLLRVFTTIIMRELNVYTLIGDMYMGVSAAYATFVGYDEVAHHSGVESVDALDVLRKLDEQFGRLESAARQAPRPYHFVVLSDHGQSGGATFLQRYGLSLQELVQQLSEQYLVQGITETHEAWDYVNIFLSDMKHDELSGPTVSRVVQGSTVNGGVKLRPRDSVKEEVEKDTGILVLASGNLGLVYATNRERRVTLEEMEIVFPGLLEGLAQHEGIGFVMINSAEHGAVVVGSSGWSYLDKNQVEGEDPLLGFGPNASDHLRRYNEFEDAPDLYINSFYDEETNEVAAFEELIGCHGGLGGYQTRPFVLYPAKWTVKEELVGAPALYQQFKRWLAHLQGEIHTKKDLS